MRCVLEYHVLTDRIAKLRISEIKRADMLDFRERLAEKLDYTRTMQQTLSALKIVLIEVYFREARKTSRQGCREVSRNGRHSKSG